MLLGAENRNKKNFSCAKDKYIVNFSNVFVFCFLFLTLLLCYSNSFKASWHFDDYSNIVNKPALHLEKLKLKSITQTFYSRSENSSADNKKMFRPLACLDIGIELVCGEGQGDRVPYRQCVASYSIRSCLLYLTVLALLNTPFQREKYPHNDKFWIAFLSAILWAVNPIQTQAVTYIVQRMTAMAAFFCLFCIYLFLKARMSRTRRNSAILYLVCLLSFIAGMASKENAAMLPFILIVIEVVFFHDLTNPRLWRWVCWSAALIALIVCCRMHIHQILPRFSFLYRRVQDAAIQLCRADADRAPYSFILPVAYFLSVTGPLIVYA